ncbi:MAG: MBL fold metallo-hydrolase, partial [Candidatus Hodarchaeota archaeon]
IMDVGTSNEVSSVLNFMKANDLSLKKVKYIVPSHFHFDHFGGGGKLWKIIKEYNPDAKILTTENTQEQLQDPDLHLQRAKRTFGDFVGTMDMLPDKAYEIVDPNERIRIPGLKRSKEFMLVSSPGHTPDHVCPALFERDTSKFMYLGEAAGAIFHSNKPITFGTSMPPDYNFKMYLQSLDKIIEFKPQNVGYCHFGAIKGEANVIKALRDNKEFTIFFRNFVKEKFSESGKIRHVVEQFIEQELGKRIESQYLDLLTNTIVALVYGQLIDLGLKKPK